MATPSPVLSFGGYSETTIETVGPARRAIARIIDHVVHLMIAVCSGFFLGIVITIVSLATGHDPQALIERFSATGNTFTSLALSLLGLIAYHIICEGLHGSSVGKLIVGIAVTMDDGSSPCTLLAAAKRSLGYVVDSLFFGLIGYFAMKNSPLHQRNGDNWADTIVRKRTLIDPAARRSGLRFAGVLLLAVIVDSMLVTSAVITKLF